MDLTLCDLLGRRTAGSPGLRYHRGVQEAGVSSVTKPGCDVCGEGGMGTASSVKVLHHQWADS